jgi:hypothetical protein
MVAGAADEEARIVLGRLGLGRAVQLAGALALGQLLPRLVGKLRPVQGPGKKGRKKEGKKKKKKERGLGSEDEEEQEASVGAERKQ